MKYDFWNNGINPILGYKIENRNVLAQRKAYQERQKKLKWEKYTNTKKK